MFRRPKEVAKVEPKPVIKCDFCKNREAIGKVHGINYCSDSVCIGKWWKCRADLDNN